MSSPCAHCGAVGESFELQGVRYCSKCGKKHTAPPPEENSTAPAFLVSSAQPTTAKARRSSVLPTSPPPSSDLLRAEIEASFRAELEILTMESRDLTLENEELKKTTREAVEAFENLLKETAGKSHDFKASEGLLEAELYNARRRLESEEALSDTLKRELADLRKAAADQAAGAGEISMLNEKLTEQLDKIRSDYEDLRENATAKLRAGAQEYLSLKSSSQDLQRSLEAAQMENEALSENFQRLTEKLKESEADKQKMLESANEAQQKRQEIRALQEELKKSQAAKVALEGRAEESSAVTQRYKEQILVEREKSRSLEASLKHLEQETQRILQDFEALTEENGKLAEALQQKEAENEELSSMVEKLIEQAENGKSQEKQENPEDQMGEEQIEAAEDSFVPQAAQAHAEVEAEAEADIESVAAQLSPSDDFDPPVDSVEGGLVDGAGEENWQEAEFEEQEEGLEEQETY